MRLLTRNSFNKTLLFVALSAAVSGSMDLDCVFW